MAGFVTDQGVSERGPRRRPLVVGHDWGPCVVIAWYVGANFQKDLPFRLIQFMEIFYFSECRRTSLAV